MAETVEIQMPQMGESVTEGTVLEWHKQEGEYVAEGETVVEVSTDKIDAEVPAPASGVITRILKGPDETIEVGGVLAELDPSAEPSGNGAAASSTDGGREQGPGLGLRAHGRRRRGPGRRGRPVERAPAGRDRDRHADRRSSGTRRRRTRSGARRRRCSADLDARDGRVGHRGHRARVARLGGRAGRRGRHGRGGLHRQGRRRGPRSGQRRDHEASGVRPTTPSRSARRWPR